MLWDRARGSNEHLAASSVGSYSGSDGLIMNRANIPRPGTHLEVPCTVIKNVCFLLPRRTGPYCFVINTAERWPFVTRLKPTGGEGSFRCCTQYKFV